MAFPKTQPTFPGTPDVIVTFEGLMAMKFQSPAQGQPANLCKIGILNAANHYLSVRIEKWSKTGNAHEVIWPKAAAILGGMVIIPLPLVSDIKLNTLNPMTSQSGLSCYKPAGSLIRNPIKDPNDFRWIVNVSDFFSEKLQVSPSLTAPTITFATGCIYTETLIPSQPTTWYMKKINGDIIMTAEKANDLGILETSPKLASARMLVSAANSIGVRISLSQSNGEFSIDFGQNKTKVWQKLVGPLPILKPSPDWFYKVVFRNLDASITALLGTSDLPLYFVKQDVTNPNNTLQSLDIVPTIVNTPEHPCVPILLDP